MELDKEKALKLVIVVLATLAALAVMSTLVQLIQTVLPFIIVGAGIYVGYRWALGDAPAPTADEVEEQARGIFGRFRRTKQAVETTMKVGEALGDLGVKSEKREKNEATVVKGEATKVDRAEITAEATADVATSAGAAPKKEGRKERRRRRNQTQQKDKGGRDRVQGQRCGHQRRRCSIARHLAPGRKRKRSALNQRRGARPDRRAPAPPRRRSIILAPNIIRHRPINWTQRLV